MATFDTLESNGVSKVGMSDWSEGSEQSEPYDAQESKDLGDDLLDDLDSYWEDINDRLTISRMVSDSIIKGMVNAVSEDAAEKVAAKELEVAKMKDRLCCSEIDSYIALRKHDELQLHEHHRESLGILNQAVKEQFQKLQNCIAKTKGSLFSEVISTPDIEKLSGNFEENLLLKNDLDEVFYSLKATLKAMCQQVDVIVQAPEDFVEEWKVELDIRKEVETMVFCAVVQGLLYEFEKQLWDVNKVLALIDKFNEISSLRHDLNSIQKCFAGLEHENLSPQASMELDHYHRKFSSNHSLPAAQDGNGECEESKISMPEKLPAELNHMKSQELYQYFRTVITEMKREHESTVCKMTEENFTLKRELLKESKPVKERGPFAALKKDRDYEVIKKDISKVIAKLDIIVRENEKLSEFCNHSREKLDSLLSENHHLKGLLCGQKLEVRHLSMQASDAAEKLLQRSWAEENMHKLVGDLKDALQDEQIEASISEDVFKCMIREMAALRNSSCDDVDLKSIIMQDIIGAIYDEALHTVDIASNLDYEEDLDMQCSIIQQIYGIVFQEVLRDASVDLNELKDKCLMEVEGLVFLQTKLLDTEKELTIKVEENEELRHNMVEFENSIAEKDKLLLKHTAVNEAEKTKFAEELNNLMCLKIRQEALISERNEEIVLLEGKVKDCQKQLESYKFEVDKLKIEIELFKDELRKSEEEKSNIKSVLKQKQKYLSSIELKETEQSKHMESLCHVIHDLSKSFADFELRIKESVGWHNVRLENSAFQLHSLISKYNVLRRTSCLYKERLEKKSSDLQKAEAEVDLLGDEVDALLSLLGKIYVALDHYAPILQHYPGIIEILKLVKRELSGEAVNAV